MDYNIDYVDDICMLSHRIMDFDQMLLDFERMTIAGLIFSTLANKTKVVNLRGHRTRPICTNEQSIGGFNHLYATCDRSSLSDVISNKELDWRTSQLPNNAIASYTIQWNPLYQGGRTRSTKVTNGFPQEHLGHKSSGEVRASREGTAYDGTRA